jgi:hypothetical protein
MSWMFSLGGSMSGAGSACFSDLPAPALLVETTCWFVVRAAMLRAHKSPFNRQTVTAQRQAAALSFPPQRSRSGTEAGQDAIIPG